MQENILSIDTLLSYVPLSESLQETVHENLEQKRKKMNRKIVVLDDDPTGTQTVHDINVYTDWEEESIRAGFQEDSNMFFILTNSRSFSSQHTEEVHRAIGERIAKISKEYKRDYILVSRGDSTLRGHYPLETATLKKAIERVSAKRFDGEILFPFFVEGGRYTIGNIHYAQDENKLVPVGKTEFSKDKTFGYRSSDLTEWCEEKTKGQYRADTVTAITLEELRSCNIKKITEKLMGIRNYNKVIVNAIDYEDIAVFLNAYFNALEAGKEFLFRSAASLVKALGGIRSRPLLDCRKELANTSQNGGIIIVGSHVQKTTDQLEYLKNGNLPVEFIQYDQHRVLEKNGLQEETRKVAAEAERLVRAGRIVAVYTRRDRLDLDTDDSEKQLEVSTEISDAIVRVIAGLDVQPRFLIAKGGITSSDIATKALHIWRAKIMGQIEPGIPVWLAGPESKFPGMAYIIFPGNVGNEKSLFRIVSKLM